MICIVLILILILTTIIMNKMLSVELLTYHQGLLKRKTLTMCNCGRGDCWGDCWGDSYCENKCTHEKYKCDNCNIQFCGCCYNSVTESLVCPKCNKQCEFKNCVDCAEPILLNGLIKTITTCTLCPNEICKKCVIKNHSQEVNISPLCNNCLYVEIDK
ncbi:MAG: hypothetical protein O7C58_09075, partial [Rickettsia endosymbiont of Ixodes persulcatus]|nr:hypothetical protein [Rickettsia endosymbiont of Ixodes persulcatus]